MKTIHLIIGGTTLHTGLAFPYGNRIADEASQDGRMPKVKKYLDDVEVVIVDEMSLVSAGNLYNLHTTLCTIFNSEELFGGRCTLLVGDILQLPPVKGTSIFKDPHILGGTAMWKTSELNLWENSQSVLLETNFRQGEGAWTQLLNRKVSSDICICTLSNS